MSKKVYKFGVEFALAKEPDKESLKRYNDMIKGAIDYTKLLNKYGPEGLYAIADHLKEVADKDMAIVLKGYSCDDPEYCYECLWSNGEQCIRMLLDDDEIIKIKSGLKT